MKRSAPARASRLGPSHLLLAVLVLAARLLGPAMPVAQAADVVLPGAVVICHAADPSAPPSQDLPHPAGHAHDCLLCPACHLAGQAVLPSAPTLLHWTGAPAVAEVQTAPPPSTGPPHPSRLAARPTGPPASAI